MKKGESKVKQISADITCAIKVSFFHFLHNSSPNTSFSHIVSTFAKFCCAYKYLPQRLGLHVIILVAPSATLSFTAQAALASPFPMLLSPILMLKFLSLDPQQSPKIV